MLPKLMKVLGFNQCLFSINSALLQAVFDSTLDLLLHIDETTCKKSNKGCLMSCRRRCCWWRQSVAQVNTGISWSKDVCTVRRNASESISWPDARLTAVSRNQSHNCDTPWLYTTVGHKHHTGLLRLGCLISSHELLFYTKKLLVICVLIRSSLKKGLIEFLFMKFICCMCPILSSTSFFHRIRPSISWSLSYFSPQ